MKDGMLYSTMDKRQKMVKEHKLCIKLVFDGRKMTTINNNIHIIAMKYEYE